MKGGTWHAAGYNDNEEPVGWLRVRETGSGCLDRFVSGTLAVQTCPLKPAAYVRQCGVRFGVVRGDGVHVTCRNETRGVARPCAFASDEGEDDRSVLARAVRWTGISNELVC